LIKVTFQRRGCQQFDLMNANKIVDCRGIAFDPLQATNPVLRDLIDRGLARPDPLRIGIDLSGACALISASGEPSNRIFAVAR
jgi:uncharacterized NAD(P)/FAD-binding protein YdhS